MIQGIQDVERFVVFCVNHERLLQVVGSTDISREKQSNALLLNIICFQLVE
jgi:hypothetical protein